MDSCCPLTWLPGVCSFARSPFHIHSLMLWLLSGCQRGRGSWVLVVIGAIGHAVQHAVGPRGALRGTLALFWPIAQVNVKMRGSRRGFSLTFLLVWMEMWPKKKKRLHPWVLSYSRGWMCRSWQASQMSAPVAKVPHSQNETHDWKNIKMLICYSVCKPVERQKPTGMPASVTFTPRLSVMKWLFLKQKPHNY